MRRTPIAGVFTLSFDAEGKVRRARMSGQAAQDFYEEIRKKLKWGDAPAAPSGAAGEGDA